jgi:hypothetical protein
MGRLPNKELPLVFLRVLVKLNTMHELYLSKSEGEPWRLWVGQRKVCKDIRKEIVEATRGKICREYWVK